MFENDDVLPWSVIQKIDIVVALDSSVSLPLASLDFWCNSLLYTRSRGVYFMDSINESQRNQILEDIKNKIAVPVLPEISFLRQNKMIKKGWTIKDINGTWADMHDVNRVSNIFFRENVKEKSLERLKTQLGIQE